MADQAASQDIGTPIAPPGDPFAGPSILPGGKTITQPLLVRNEVLRAVQHAAEAVTLATDTREMNEAAQAVEHLVNGLTKMTPQLDSSGSPVALQAQQQEEQRKHEVTMAELNASNQSALEDQKHNNAMQLENLRGQNQQKAAKAKTVSVKRDAQGRPASYTTSG